MECNKEEAIRAKGIAVEKMKNKDFAGARKIGLKAQQLYPDLEHITQILLVCEVHCSAENKAFGNEKDLYGILKIDQTADESSIKKQYRKFALLLHPDKNMFPGATDAFKLIGEAQRVLLDRDKRVVYDNKFKAARSSSGPTWPPKQACNSTNVTKPPTNQNPFMNKATSQFPGGVPQPQQRFPGGVPQPQQRFPGGNPQTQQRFPGGNPPTQQPQMQNQTGNFGDQETFWTVCPYCYVRYQFYRTVINKLLCCQSCKRNFPGYEMNKPPTGEFSAGNGKPIPNPNKGARKASGAPSRPKQPVAKTGTSQVDKEFAVGKDGGNQGVKVKSEGQTEDCKTPGKVNGKGKRKIPECNSDSDEDVAMDENGDIHAKKNFGCFGEGIRRSSRSKPPVSYDEKRGGNDEFGSPPKKPKYSESSHVSEDPMTKDEKPDVSKSGGVKQNGFVSRDGPLPNGKVDSEHKSEDSPSSSAASEPNTYEYPDPDFNDFDKTRSEDCFVVGQIWAVYDTIDAMPRFYARIRKVITPGFKVRITWLEPDPEDKDEVKWVGEGLPISCGRFKNGSSETTEDHLMFSHLMLWEKGNKRESYSIHPRRGETWAIFRDWDIKWHSDTNTKEKYDFEFVEILSDYSKANGVSVAFLGKVKGFTCLFCRIGKEGMESRQVPPDQMLRFSHKVPSFRLSGEERNDVPRGSFEFDPASFPTDLEEVVAPEHLTAKVGNTDNNPSPKFQEGDPTEQVEEVVAPATEQVEEEVAPEHSKVKVEIEITDTPSSKSSAGNPTEQVDTSDHEDHDSAEPESFVIPEPEFYNFDNDKSPEKFQVGQIWALYSDEDGLPKYYAQVKKIDREPEFKLHIAWLVPGQSPKNMVKWVDKKMIISCGSFRSQKGVPKRYTETNAFSHPLKVKFTDTKECAIYPSEGEVWSLYKDWHPRIKASELETWDHDIVEILEVSDSKIKVLFLELVGGFKSVFKAQAKTMEIDRTEILRFSHHIPAFKLTNERDGSLRGYWELDPAALPIAMFCLSS